MYFLWNITKRYHRDYHYFIWMRQAKCMYTSSKQATQFELSFKVNIYEWFSFNHLIIRLSSIINTSQQNMGLVPNTNRYILSNLYFILMRCPFDVYVTFKVLLNVINISSFWSRRLG